MSSDVVSDPNSIVLIVFGPLTIGLVVGALIYWFRSRSGPRQG